MGALAAAVPNVTIGVLPFSTALMSEYLREGEGANLAAAVYGGSFLVMSLAFFAMQRQMLVTRHHLLDERLTPDRRRAILRRNVAGLIPFAVATLAALLSPYVTLILCAVVAAFYALPQTTADRP